jgi:beta-glucosidase
VAQSVPLVTGDARVDKLLSQMTLEEKLILIHGAREDPSVYQGQAGYLPGILRLGIPALRLADGPPGVLTRHPSQAESCTMAVAATFNRKSAEDNGIVIGREDRALGIDVSLQPFVNIARDLDFSRAYNTLGEDPLLSAQLGAAEIRGIQSQHVMSQVKHFIGYDTNGSSVFIDQQTLHEVYLAPFEAAIQAGVSSVMCSYNRINGEFACGNESVLNKILRDELGFKGFVTSDWGAVHAVSALNAGLDMEMPGPPGKHDVYSIPSFYDAEPVPPPHPFDAGIAAIYGTNIPEEPPFIHHSGGGSFGLVLDPKKMPEAIRDGSVNEALITRAAGHILYEIVRFGYMDGESKHEITTHSIDENAKIIEKTGEDAAVLLKNENGALPLKPESLNDTVLIGPGAAQVFAIGTSGERSVGMPERQVGPYEALRKISGNSKIRLAVDDDMTGSPIPASALSHDGKPGLERRISSQPAVTDAQINFTVKLGNALPVDSTISWSGTLTVEKPGIYWLYLQALGTNASYFIDGNQVGHTGALQGAVHGDILQANQDNAVPTIDGLDDVRRAVQLTAGAHMIEVRVSPDTSHAPVQVRLNWYTPGQRAADNATAIAAAKSAKTAVVFLWSRLNPVFGLPGEQDKLVEEVAAVNSNTIVVLNTSQPVALPWLDKVKAVLEMWWPGDEGGWATANLLLGKSSPAGRLPVTWGKQLQDYPASDPQHPERSMKGVDGKTTYSEGIDVGYRWFDRKKIEPHYPFGYGLSYTSFDYSNLKVVNSSDGGLDVTFTIRNKGGVASDEVPQVYIGAPETIPTGIQFPVRTFAAFDRIAFAVGETKTVTLHVAPRQLQYWSSDSNKWITASGKRVVSVGASSRDLRIETTVVE